MPIRLQRTVVQQRNGDARLRREMGLQQCSDGRCDFLALRIIARPMHLLAGARGHSLVGIVRAAGICGRRGSVGFSMTKEMFDRTEPRRGNPNQQHQCRANAKRGLEPALLRTSHITFSATA